MRPQNLIGERFVECKPTQPRTANAEPPPQLREIEDGPGEGQYLLPVENTMQTVDIDLIGNTMREPERERLSLILNELGTGVAGRGKDLNEVIRRANPALQETDKVLQILARQNDQLEQLAVNSDTVLAPLARDREQVASAVRNSSEVAKATAEKRDALADDIQTLPRFLDELEPTMVRLGALADESTPVLTDLGANATDINNLIRRLGPFSEAAMPAIDSLGEASKTGTPAVIAARPVIADLRGLAKAVLPVGVTLRAVLESFRDTGGIERAMDYIFYQAAAVNGFDAVGHYLRAGLLVNAVHDLRRRPRRRLLGEVPGGRERVLRASARRPRSRRRAATPCCARPRRRWPTRSGRRSRRRASSRPRPTSQRPTRERGAAERKPRKPARRGGKPKRDEEIPEAIPTVDPAAPTPAPSAGAAAAAPAAEAAPAAAAPPATPTPTPAPADPADALLDYLFGGDG